MSIFEDTLDNYASNNALADTNIYAKVIFALGTMIINLFAQSPIIPILIFLSFSSITILKAKIASRFYLKFISVPLVFGLITFLYMSLFFGSGEQILSLNIFNWGITAEGLNRGFLVLTKVMGGFSCLVFLALTTPVNRLFALCDEIHIPHIITDIALLMYRYIFVFLDVTLNIYNAQKTRLGYSGYKNSFQCLGILAGLVFIQTWEKSDELYNTLLSRGYTGEIVLIHDRETIYDLRKTQLFLIGIFEVALVIGILLSGTMNII
ncbi:MAG: cobalt ECF transporter T component CbiQ [Methanobacteriaceae archaeon]|nr:cobalt ECF transporter T component CbiQ [Methanobacteriaceae archaeon]